MDTGLLQNFLLSSITKDEEQVAEKVGMDCPYLIYRVFVDFNHDVGRPSLVEFLHGMPAGIPKATDDVMIF